jgi:hypothetical protein
MTDTKELDEALTEPLFGLVKAMTHLLTLKNLDRTPESLGGEAMLAINKAQQTIEAYISKHYISKQSVSQALKDTLMKDGSPVNHTAHKLRQQIRKELGL